MSQFDLKKFLVENKLTSNSRLLNENLNENKGNYFVNSLSPDEIDNIYQQLNDAFDKGRIPELPHPGLEGESEENNLTMLKAYATDYLEDLGADGKLPIRDEIDDENAGEYFEALEIIASSWVESLGDLDYSHLEDDGGYDDPSNFYGVTPTSKRYSRYTY